jgi:DNA-binding PadR family transcriptional regulator
MTRQTRPRTIVIAEVAAENTMADGPEMMPTRSEMVVLKLLQHRPSGAYGLEIVADSNGTLKRSSLYVLLGRLEEKGFVRIKSTISEHPGLPRPIYVISGEGLRVVRACELVEVTIRGSLCAR